MKKILLLLSLLSVSAQAGNILVLNTTGQSPLNRPDGEGFMDIITRQALKEVGYDLATVRLPAERGLINVNEAIDDGEMSRIEGLEKSYPNLRRVPEKIMQWEFVIFSKNQSIMGKGWQSLAEKNVAYINGWKIIEKNIPASAIVNRVKSVRQLFYLLENDRTDYIIYEKWAGLEIIKNRKLENVHMLQPPLAVKDMYIYLNKKHEDIIAPLAISLKKMKQNGSYENFKNKFLAE